MSAILFSFALQRGLIICPVVIYHNQEYVIAYRMAVDTGASYSIIDPDIVNRLHIDYADADLVNTMTAEKMLSLPKVTLQQLGIHQANVANVDVLVGGLPKELAIDGLLGYSFLKHFEITINYSKQEIKLVSVSEP